MGGRSKMCFLKYLSLNSELEFPSIYSNVSDVIRIYELTHLEVKQVRSEKKTMLFTQFPDMGTIHQDRDSFGNYVTDWQIRMSTSSTGLPVGIGSMNWLLIWRLRLIMMLLNCA